VNDERENEPDDQVDPHQPPGPLPMDFLLGTGRTHALPSSCPVFLAS
jgi:hypothetical protein